MAGSTLQQHEADNRYTACRIELRLGVITGYSLDLSGCAISESRVQTPERFVIFLLVSSVFLPFFLFSFLRVQAFAHAPGRCVNAHRGIEFITCPRQTLSRG